MKELVWWDDQLIEDMGHGSGENTRHCARTSFNCRGYGRLILGEKPSNLDKQLQRARSMHVDNTEWSNFTDEWDCVLESVTVEDNSPEIISSTGGITKKTIEHQSAKPFIELDSVIAIAKPTATETEFTKATITVLPIELIKSSAIEEKYIARKKVFAAQIPVSGDSIELHFYDNGQVDGDSISLFLNDKLIFEHIRLTDKAYSIKLSVRELNFSNELIMVAENLGSIPPNTSYMVATVVDKMYEARLESTEGSNAVIRLVKVADER